MSTPPGESPKLTQELSTEEIATAEAALALFAREHWDKPVPELSEPERDAVRAYFASQDMVVAAYMWPIGPLEVNPFQDDRSPQPRPLQNVLTIDRGVLAELDSSSDAIAGPYFLGDEYIPEAVAVWRGKERTEASL